MPAPRKADHIVAVDVGGTKIISGVATPDGRILSRSKKKTKPSKGVEAVIDRVLRTVREAQEASEIGWDRIAAVSIGFPGPLDSAKGIIYAAPNLDGWQNIPLGEALEKDLQKPVIIDNDVNMGTLGEHEFGAGKGSANLIGIFVGTGIGGGIVVNNQLLGGRNGTAGEIGHMTILAGGPKCGCGAEGCYEALASRTAITRAIVKAIEGGKDSILADSIKKDRDARITSGALKEAIDSGDKVVIRAVTEASWYLGVGAGSLINILGPDVIVFGGGVIEALEDFMMEIIREAADKVALDDAARDVRIVPAALGDDAVMMGCVASAWKRLRFVK